MKNEFETKNAEQIDAFLKNIRLALRLAGPEPINEIMALRQQMSNLRKHNGNWLYLTLHGLEIELEKILKPLKDKLNSKYTK